MIRISIGRGGEVVAHYTNMEIAIASPSYVGQHSPPVGRRTILASDHTKESSLPAFLQPSACTSCHPIPFTCIYMSRTSFSCWSFLCCRFFLAVLYLLVS